MFLILLSVLSLIVSGYCKNNSCYDVPSYNNIVTVLANETSVVNTNFNKLTYTNCEYKLEQTNDCSDIASFSKKGKCKNIVSNEIYIIYKNLTDQYCNVTYNITFYNCDSDDGGGIGFAALVIMLLLSGLLLVVMPISACVKVLYDKDLDDFSAVQTNSNIQDEEIVEFEKSDGQ